jgi:acetyltransferase-like isoleucine patch superfamily enzyme
MRALRWLVRRLAWNHGKAVGWYLRFCRPNGDEWAEFLRRRDTFHRMGEQCSIQSNVVVTDPKYVSVGSNVRLSGCTLFGHDGSVNMLMRAYGVVLDRVGKIELRDHVYVGHGATILPGVTIGPRALVAAGSVVNRDVPENSVVAGVPARVVGKLDEYVERLRERTAALPWAALLERRTHENYWELQPEIERLRMAHFFGSEMPDRKP